MIIFSLRPSTVYPGSVVRFPLSTDNTCEWGRRFRSYQNGYASCNFASFDACLDQQELRHSRQQLESSPRCYSPRYSAVHDLTAATDWM